MKNSFRPVLFSIVSVLIIFNFACGGGGGDGGGTTSTTPADTTAPSVPAGLNAAASKTSISLTWNPSTDNVGVAGYNIYRNGQLLIYIANETYYDDAGVTVGTEYYYEISALDSSGNESALSTKTLAIIPTAGAPSTPTGLAATASKTSIFLIWNPSTDDVGVAGYKVYRDGNFIASVAGTSFEDTGRTAGIQYCYNVSAYDADGNQSGVSAGSCAFAAYNEAEPNDTPGNATTILLNTQMCGNNSYDQSDYFVFTLTENKEVTITLQFINDPNVDLDLYLYDSVNPGLDAGIIDYSWYDCPKLITQTLTAGTYYIEVYGYSPTTNNVDFSIVVSTP